MKLVHPYYFHEIDFENEEPHTLIIERASFFRQIISELMYEAETGIGDYVLSQNYEVLDFAKYCSVIVDPFSLDYQNKQIKNGLQKQAVELLSVESELPDIIHRINQLGLRIANQFSPPVAIKQDIGISDITTILDFRIDISDLSFAEQLLEYCKISRDLAGVKMFITIHLKEYLDPEEYQQIIEMFCNEKLLLLMLESRQHPLIDDPTNTIIVDNDYCII